MTTEKKLPAGTTQEQWDAYHEAMTKHVTRVIEETPYIQDYENEADFNKAFAEWEKMKFMDEPNKPGYYRANND